MLFNSIDFAVFLPLVFLLYWFVFQRNLRLQNLFLVVVSYVFYGWWDWRFLFLIAFSTLVDYVVGRGLAGEERVGRRRLLVGISLAANLGLLGFFKYYNFFLDNFVAAFTFFGHPLQARSLNIILPVGISFYTFQTLSYTLDVYARRMKANRDPVAFWAYVSFFPQLVAGPIERATRLLPQFLVPRRFNESAAVDGLRQILWGFFKKLVIADTCAVHVNRIFQDCGAYSGSTLFLGVFLFAFQIYSDFSGYSDIAIGTARLFGFDLMRNFAFPYFSRDHAEFWRRWHISLSTWFRDYLYVPLGGSRGSLAQRVRNTFIIFLVSGFWHGANWTFLVWGALNALYFLPLMVTGRNRRHLDIIAQGRRLPSPGELARLVGTFLLTLLAWVFFRAQNLGHALQYLRGIFSASLFHPMEIQPLAELFMIAFFIAMEWRGREQPYALAALGLRWPRLLRWSLYAFILFLIGMYMQTEETPFIYFQF